MNQLACNVKGCKYRLSRRLPRNVSLYMLPRDAPSQLKAAWRRVCGVGRLTSCSQHFTENDFMSEEAPTTGNTSRGISRPLKHNVVPKLNLKRKIQKPRPARAEVSSPRDDVVVLDSDDEGVMESGDPLQIAAPDGMESLPANPVGGTEESTGQGTESIPCKKPKTAAKSSDATKEIKKQKQFKNVAIIKKPRGRTPAAPTIPPRKPLMWTPSNSEISKPAISSESTSSNTKEAPALLSSSTSSIKLLKPPATVPPKALKPPTEEAEVTTAGESTSKVKKPSYTILREVKIARKKFRATLDTQKLHAISVLQRKDLTVQKIVQKRKTEDEGATSKGCPAEPPTKQPRMGNLKIRSVKSINETVTKNQEQSKTVSISPDQRPNKKHTGIRFCRVKLYDKVYGARCLNCSILLRNTDHSRLQLHVNVCKGVPSAKTDQELVDESDKQSSEEHTEQDNAPDILITKVTSKKTGQTKKVTDLSKKTSSVPVVVPVISSVETLQKPAEPPNNPQPKRTVLDRVESSKTATASENEDDDVIVLPQKIDVIDVNDSESDGEEKQGAPQPNKCHPTTCKFNEKLQAAVKRNKSLLKLRESLTMQQEILEYNITKIVHRHESSNSFLKNILNILTQTQKDIFFGLKSKVVWQHDEIQGALVLRYLSKDLYLYLREELKYPLPSLASLVKWEKEFPVQADGVRDFALNFNNNKSDDDHDEEEDAQIDIVTKWAI